MRARLCQGSSTGILGRFRYTPDSFTPALANPVTCPQGQCSGGRTSDTSARATVKARASRGMWP